MTKVAVILSGCGVYDGAEIHESVLTLLYLDELGLDYEIFAPNVAQLHVINHLNGEPEPGAQRNVLVEAARIARGQIEDIADADPNSFAAAILPGGFGAAKNLSDFAAKGANCEVHSGVKRFVAALHADKKPLGFICIAPALVPKIIDAPVQVTIGNDIETASEIEKMGGKHVNCDVRDIIVDEERCVVTTPAYMLAQSIGEAAAGIKKLVEKIQTMLA